MIRLEHALTVRRFCELIGVPRNSYYRRRRREADDGLARGPWPTPVLDRIDSLVAEVAASFGFFGYRKVWGRLRLDGQDAISASSVRRSMGRQGLLQPRRYQAERRALVQAQLDDDRDFYNTVRPHETLDQTLPISRYIAQPDNTQTEEANHEPAKSVSDS